MSLRFLNEIYLYGVNILKSTGLGTRGAVQNLRLVEIHVNIHSLAAALNLNRQQRRIA